MIDVVKVEFPASPFPPPGLAPKTRLWLSRSAISVDQKFQKRDRRDSLIFWKKVESCCRTGLQLFAGTVLRKESNYDGIYRIGIRQLNYRFYGFFDGPDFIVPEASWKPGDMGELGRDACVRAERVRRTGDWKKVTHERYSKPTR